MAPCSAGRRDSVPTCGSFCSYEVQGAAPPGRYEDQETASLVQSDLANALIDAALSCDVRCQAPPKCSRAHIRDVFVPVHQYWAGSCVLHCW